MIRSAPPHRWLKTSLIALPLLLAAIWMVAHRARAVDEKPGAAPARDQEAIDSAVEAAIEKRLPGVNLDAVGLSDAIDFLRDISGANIFVNWKALEAAGIDKNTPITLRMRDVKVTTALTAVLNDAAGGSGKLIFDVQDGVVVVSTAAALQRSTIAKVYDIRDLVGDPGQDPKKTEELGDELTKTITANIDPESWVANGGKVGVAKFSGDQLVIRQTRENQKRVVQLLDKLREVQAIRISIEARFLTVTQAFLNEQKLQLEELFTVKKTGEKVTGKFIDMDREAQLIRAVAASKEMTVLTAPRLVLLNGQRDSIIVAQQQAYVSGWSEPKEGEKRKEQISTAQTGIFLDLTGFVSADRKYVTLAINPRISQLQELKTVVWDKAPQENLKVQQPVMQLCEVNTVISIPDEGTLALVINRRDDLKENRDRIVLLLLRPTILIQREVEQKPK
jgi:hypothetical protein